MIKPFFYAFIFLGLFCNSQNEEYTVTNLLINNEYPHFGLIQLSGNKIIFTSYALTKKGKIKQSSGNPELMVYRGDLINGEIVNSKPIVIDPKQNISHVTSAAISPNGKQLYLTTNYNSKDKPKGDFKATNFHIKVGEYQESIGWTNFKVLPFCKPKFSYAHPTLSKDGKALYFVGNIRGGKETTRGGSDIFRVGLLGNNTYSEPKNLGTKVNSYSREMFPFISEDDTLYFSSNRPNGFGGYDIYKSKMNENGDFEKAVKMPKPINSIKDDFSLITSDAKTGYLSSKRPKGKGDDDIYYFEMN